MIAGACHGVTAMAARRGSGWHVYLRPVSVSIHAKGIAQALSICELNSSLAVVEILPPGLIVFL